MGAAFRHVLVQIFLTFTGKLIMNKAMIAVAAIAASGTAFAGGHTSEDNSLNLELGGFVWADVGAGDRYDGSDEDQTGISKAALSVSTSVDNVTASMILGVDSMINEPFGSNGSNANDEVEVKEAWIAIDFDLVNITLGKQALGFGLKPAGWVGGRDINDAIQFGGADSPNVSGQVVTGIAADMELGDFTLRAAMFDSVDAGADNSMIDNFMIQVRSDGLFGTGIYASVGYEELADAIDGDIEVTSFGAGYDFGLLDLSIESQSVDTDFGDADTIIFAASIPLNDRTGVYVDYADGENAETTRVGVNFSYNDNVDFILEYADDEYDAGFGTDTDSIDLRVALSFN
jgi:hypothetical protein